MTVYGWRWAYALALGAWRRRSVSTLASAALVWRASFPPPPSVPSSLPSSSRPSLDSIGPAAEAAAASWAVQFSAVRIQGVVVWAPAGAGGLQRGVAASHAKRVGIFVRAEPSARGAPLDRHRLARSQSSGSTARPLGRISKCRCGSMSGSDTPTVPITWPFVIFAPLATRACASEP